ncbi:D-aminopeptidase, partial [Metarhizium brunneum ARSEF 3297]
MVAQKPSSRIRDWGYSPGRFPTGPRNSVLDVPGVRVGQVDINKGEDVHTGVTVIFPRGIDKTTYIPCYGAVHDMNGIGEWTGVHQLREWGFSRAVRTIFAFPLVVIPSEDLTNHTADCIHEYRQRGQSLRHPWRWTAQRLRQDGIADLLDQVQYYGFPTVGETFDGLLNNIFKSAVEEEHVLAAIKSAETQGAAGTGTSSRVLKGDGDIEYTVGVIVQNNYGSMDDLQIDGVPVGRMLKARKMAMAAPTAPESGKAAEGTQRAGMGLSQVSGHGVGRNFSGEFFMALSTANTPESPSSWDGVSSSLPPLLETDTVETMKSMLIDSVFVAAAEATEEALLNSMTEAETMKGFNGFEAKALPRKEVEELLRKHGRGYVRDLVPESYTSQIGL